MATKRLTKVALVAAHDEIDKEIGIEPPIDSELKLVDYQAELKETVVQLELTPEEITGLSAKTQALIAILIPAKEDEAPVKKETEPVEVSNAPEEEEAPVEKVEKEKPVTKEKTPFTAAEYNRVDALCAALKESPNNQDEWARIADDILTKKGGTTKPNIRENKFTIGYFVKIAKHMDLGAIPPKK